MDRETRIETPCPSCGSRTLFIGEGGHLTCSLIGCKEPVVERAYAAETARADREAAARQEAERQRDMAFMEAHRVEAEGRAERDRLRAELAECHRLTGTDPEYAVAQIRAIAELAALRGRHA